MMKSKHRRKPFMNTVFPKRCSLLIFWSCMIAGFWIGIVFALVVYGNSDSEPKPASGYIAPEIDWELVKVLSEMDIRTLSPEHQAFLQEYNATKRE